MLEKMFANLFKAAEEANSTGFTHLIGERTNEYEDRNQESLHNDSTDVLDDRAMNALFTQMTKNGKKWIKKIKNHNHRLPNEVQKTKIKHTNLTEEQKRIQWDEVELYKRTEHAGPLKRFEEDFKERKRMDTQHKGAIEWNKSTELVEGPDKMTTTGNEQFREHVEDNFGIGLRTETPFKKRGGKLNKLKEQVRGLKNMLKAATMENDEYCMEVMKQRRKEMNKLKRGKKRNNKNKNKKKHLG